MTEKVLGFKEKGTKVLTEVDTYYQVEENELVPVVSVEWLENWCKEHQDWFFKPHHNDLLAWAKKEASN